MVSNMTPVLAVLVAVAAVAVALPPPVESSVAENPLRTVNREVECEYSEPLPRGILLRCGYSVRNRYALALGFVGVV